MSRNYNEITDRILYKDNQCLVIAKESGELGRSNQEVKEIF